jgi:hypothetical protein
MEIPRDVQSNKLIDGRPCEILKVELPKPRGTATNIGSIGCSRGISFH